MDAGLEPPRETSFATECLRMRTLRLTDAANMLPILSKPEVTQYTSVGHPLSTIAEAESWVSRRALGADIFNFVIELRSEVDSNTQTKIIGVVGSFARPCVGYLLHPGTVVGMNV